MQAERHTTANAFSGSALQQLQAGLRGELLRPDDPGFDAARRVWNGMIDRRPALIARCRGVADVSQAVEFARNHGLLLAVRGGGHNIAGNAVCDGGLMLDLSLMRGVWVDPAGRTARAQGGATWGDLDRETQVFGLATTGGHVSTTGIAGLTLGGGIGWLMRKHGLACDNLLSADVVTAAGECLRASAAENAELFWGLRGGGGNFGVVTSFEYQLHPVGPVLGGMVLHPAAKAAAVARFYREYVTTAPDELTTGLGFLTGPPAPFLPEALHGQPLVAIIACYTGSMEEGERVVAPLRAFGPPVVDLLQPIPYGALQTMFDAAFPPGLMGYWKNAYLDNLSDGAIDLLVSSTARVPSPQTLVAVLQLGGAVSRASDDETPVNLRRVPYVVLMASTWTDLSQNEENIRWTREFAAALQPFSTGGEYVNFTGDEGPDRVRTAYAPATYERLVRLKDRYDPTNLFRLNQNIRPTV